MRRYKHLSSSLCIRPELFGQFLQKFGIQLVLRLFDGEQRVRLGIVEQHQIRKHFYGAVGHVSGDEWIFETPILKPQYQSSIVRGPCFYTSYSWNATAHRLQNLLETVFVIFEKKLSNLCDIVSAS